MRIAILMSTYNGEFYLKEQIESILKLDKSVEGLAGGNNPSFEFEIDLWVRDDGSTDSTIIILNEYMKNGLLNWYGGANVGAARSFIDLMISYLLLLSCWKTKKRTFLYYMHPMLYWLMILWQHWGWHILLDRKPTINW